MPQNLPSIKEQRIKKITQLYYSRPEIQKVLYEFSQNREVCPRYFEGFGKRPDSFQYPSDVFAFVKNNATSFHCSQELWKEPLQIQTGMTEIQLNELRMGWDLLIDIDSKYIDYSKICADVIIQMLKFHGIKNIGVKFSGSKGFHLIIPWKSFPEEISGAKTSDKFPEYPRIITRYIMEKIKHNLIDKISNLERPNKYVMDFLVSKEVMPDLVLVSPRHLFRMPYSLHEKTSLASIVIDAEKILEFELKDADPMKVEIKQFIPESEKDEAKELLMQALDWHRENNLEEEEKKQTSFQPVKIDNLSDKNFPPCVKNIFQGISDGKKRAVFILANFFRSLGMEKEELEKRIYEWNEKNESPLQKAYISSQLSWAFRKNPILPPNCKEYYQGIGVCIPDGLCGKIKNPVNYTARKSFVGNRNYKKQKTSEGKKERKSKQVKENTKRSED